MKISKRNKRILIVVFSIITLVCAFCGCATTEEWTIKRKVEATCTQSGYTEYVNAFGITKKGDEIQAYNHNFSLISESEPTCSAKGLKVYECSRCGEVKEEYANPNGHVYEMVDVIEPDCMHSGYTLKSCICGKSIKENIVDALGHDLIDVETLSYGAIKQQCDRCKEYFFKTQVELDGNGEFSGFTYENETANSLSNAWTQVGGGSVRVILDSSTGSKVLSLDKASVHSDLAVYSNAFNVIPGKAFNVSYKFKGDNYYNRGDIALRFYDKDFVLVDRFTYAPSNVGANVWVSFSTDTLVVPNNAVLCVMEILNIAYAGNPGMLSYFDDVKFNYLPAQTVSTIENGGFINSDFESINNAGLIGWSIIGANPDCVKLVQTTYDDSGTKITNAYQGANSLYIDSRSTVHGVRSPLLQVRGGVLYDISVTTVHYYYYGNVQLKVDFYRETDMAVSLASYVVSKGRDANSWTTLEISENAPANARYMVITLTVLAEAGFFDDVKIVENTEESILYSINREIEDGNVGAILPLLQKDVIGTDNVNSSLYMMKYYVALSDALAIKGSDLTKAEIQACIDAVNTNPANYTVESIISNGSLEDLNGDELVYWSKYAYASGSNKVPTAEITTLYSSQGKNSLVFHKEQGGAAGIISDYVPVEVGSMYYLSADILAIGFEPSVYLSIKYYTDKGIINSDLSRTGRKQARDSWLSAGLLVIVPEDVLYVTVSVSSLSYVTECTCYIDNVEFRKVNQDIMMQEFNELVANDDIFQVRNLLNSFEWMHTGFRMDHLSRYMYAFKKLQEDGAITYQQVYDVVNTVDNNIDTFDEELIKDIVSKVKTRLVAVNEGYLELPGSIKNKCNENYVLYKFVEGVDSDYFDIDGVSLYIKQRPGFNQNDLTTQVSVAFMLGNVTVVEQFELVILKHISLEQEALSTITFDSFKGENKNEISIMSNLILPSTVNGLPVSWLSSTKKAITDTARKQKTHFL